MNVRKDNEVFPIMGNAETTELLTEEAQGLLRMYECPYMKGKSLSGKHFLLVGKYAVADENTKITITLKVKTTTKYEMHAGYIPVSKAYYKALRNKEVILRMLNVIAGLIILMVIVSGLTWLIGSYWIPGLVRLGTQPIAIAAVSAFVWLMIATSIKSRMERKASESVVKLTRDDDKYGIPDYDRRILEFIVQTDDIKKVAIKDRALEKELKKI